MNIYKYNTRQEEKLLKHLCLAFYTIQLHTCTLSKNIITLVYHCIIYRKKRGRDFICFYNGSFGPLLRAILPNFLYFIHKMDNNKI